MRLKTTIAAGAAGLVLLGAGAASGAIPEIPAVAIVGLLNGSNSGPTEVHNDGVQLKTNGATDVATWESRYTFDQTSGWHDHPGIVIAVVKQGTVERQVLSTNGKCVTEQFTVGQSFTEVEPHNVHNLTPKSGTNPEGLALLSITAIHRQDAAEFRHDLYAAGSTESPCK